MGENIKQQRKFHGYSRKEAAEELGMSVEAYTSIEEGAYDLFVLDIKNIANLYAVSAATLIDA